MGAYGGKKEIMSFIAPEGPVYQAGTLSGNPVSMSAGIATLKQLKNDKVYSYLNEISKYLSDGLKNISEIHGNTYVMLCFIFASLTRLLWF